MDEKTVFASGNVVWLFMDTRDNSKELNQMVGVSTVVSL